MGDAPPIGAAQAVDREIFLDLLDRLPQAIVILSEDGRIRFWSSGATALLGYPEGEMIGEMAERLLPASRAATGEMARLIAHARAGGEMRDIETERLTRDGRLVSVLLTQSPIRSADGSFRGILQSLTDITEHRNILRALERRVHQMSILKEIGEALHGTMDLEEVLHLILVGATAGPGLRFNRAFLLLADEDGAVMQGRLAIGPANAEEAGRIWHELAQRPMTLHQMLRSYERTLAEIDASLNSIVRTLHLPMNDPSSMLAGALVSGTAVTLPVSQMSTSDQEIAARLATKAFAVVPLRARGRTIGALLADNAITQREIQRDDLEMLELLGATAAVAIDNSRLYAELGQRLKSLEAARAEARRSQQAVHRAERLSAIGEMAASVAHDIRNPLTAIGGFARALLSRTLPEDPSREYASIIADEVSRLEGIVTRVLDSVRPFSPDLQSVQINRILEEAARLLEAEVKEAGVEIELALDPGVPSVPADSDRIFEMVLNLIRNAVQAMPGGGALSLLTLPAGDWVELRIIDAGHGVPPALQERIFSPFFTTKTGGSGLGLTIVSQIVREHGGTLALKSEVGSGSTFIIRLPSKRSEADNDQDPDR